MDVIRYYEIVVCSHNDMPMGRIRFTRNGEIEESAWYTIGLVNEILQQWKSGELLGSFAIGTRLESGAEFQLVRQ